MSFWHTLVREDKEVVRGEKKYKKKIPCPHLLFPPSARPAINLYVKSLIVGVDGSLAGGVLFHLGICFPDTFIITIGL